MSEHDQDVFSATASEALAQGGKAVAMLRTALEMTDTRLRVAADAENLVSAARREAARALERKAEAERAAVETVRTAAAEADRIVSAAKGEAKRALDEAAMLAADNDRLRGEHAELQAQKAKLLSNVQRLTKTVADLEAIR